MSDWTCGHDVSKLPILPTCAREGKVRGIAISASHRKPCVVNGKQGDDVSMLGTEGAVSSPSNI